LASDNEDYDVELEKCAKRGCGSDNSGCGYDINTIFYTIDVHRNAARKY